MSQSAPNRRECDRPQPAEVRRQLERILAHALFSRSQRLSTFLEFVVESVLSGDESRLKESVIGMEVFERGASYSPQEDPIVRIMAGRLRSKLAEYYQTDGSQDPVVVELPRGAYVPTFQYRGHALAPTEPAPGWQKRPGPGAFVGRESELERLRSAFQSACSGSGRVVMVHGEAGIGKTALVNDFFAEALANATPLWVLRGSCSERLAESYAFVPIFECLDGLLYGESAEEVAAVLHRVAPTWLAQVSRTPPAAAAPNPETLSHERMRREFVHIFRELGRTRPVLVFLDDLHWADASTCDLLAYLGERTEGIRILIVISYRPSGVMAAGHPFLPVKVQLERARIDVDVPLSALAREDVAAYIESEFPDNRFPREFTDVVYQRTEGVPLFMTDLLRFVRETGMAAAAGAGWRLERPLDQIARIIPAGAERMIRLKLERLAAYDRRILECAAVQGIQFDSWVVASVLGMDAGEVEERLRNLDVCEQLVEAIGETDLANQCPSVRYRFRHVFYQNALAASLTLTRRIETAAGVAGTLAALDGGQRAANAADLAILFETAKDNRNAARYFQEAARSAAAVFAYPEAVLLCNRGLRALESLPESAERDQQELVFSLILGLSQMVTRGYTAPEVERTYSRSKELCLKLNESRRLVRVLWSLHTCRVNAGDLPAALALAEEMREVARKVKTPIAEIESLHAWGTTLAFMGRLAPARQALERIFEISPPGKRLPTNSLYLLDPSVTTASMLARLVALMGSAEQALAMATASLDVASRQGHPYSIAYATFWIGWVRQALGEHGEACRVLETAIDLCRTRDVPQILEWARIVRGMALAGKGQFADGIAEMRTSLDNQRAMGCFLERPFCLTALAEALIQDGRATEAMALCDEALDLSARTEARSFEPETRRVRGEAILAERGMAGAGDAEVQFRAAVHDALRVESRLLALRAAVSWFRLAQRSGKDVEARSVLAEIVGEFAGQPGFALLADARGLLNPWGR